MYSYATAAAITARINKGTQMPPPEEEEEPSSIISIIGSTIGSASVPANAVDAATVKAAASAIFFIVFSKIHGLPFRPYRATASTQDLTSCKRLKQYFLRIANAS